MNRNSNDIPAFRRSLVRILDEAYAKTGWIDRSLRRSLRKLDTSEALYRPGPGRPNPWEHVVHLAYWKHVLLRRLLGEEPVPFGEEGRDWFPRRKPDERQWRRDRKKLGELHERFRDAVLTKKRLEPLDLERVVGAAFHDVYHAAQIELTRRLYARKQRRRAGSKASKALGGATP